LLTHIKRLPETHSSRGHRKKSHETITIVIICISTELMKRTVIMMMILYLH